MAEIWYKCKAEMGRNESEVNASGQTEEDFAVECFREAYQLASEVAMTLCDDPDITVRGKIADRTFDYTFSAELLQKDDICKGDMAGFKTAMKDALLDARDDWIREGDDEMVAEIERLIAEL